VTDGPSPLGRGRRVRAWALAVAILLLARPVRAQERRAFEVVGAYTFLGSSAIVDGYGLGWVAGVGWHLADWLAIVGEIGASRQTQQMGFLELDAGFRGAFVGPRVSWSVGTRRVRPSAHVLGGALQLDLRLRSAFPAGAFGRDDETYSALQFGGALDAPLNDRLALRLALDRRRVFGPEGFNQSRFQTGVVYRLGGP